MASAAFSPGSFCAFAKTLRHRWDADEASIRTSMSRAYYGAFLEARDAKGLSSVGRDSHKRVLDAYGGTTPADQVISSSLRKLKSLREKADYEPQTTCSKSDAHDALTEADKVLKVLSVRPGKLPDLVPIQMPGAPATS